MKLPERATLVYVMHRSKVLLIEKLQGHGAGKINAPGGHFEAGESACQCAVREVREETGVVISELELVARIKFLEHPGCLSMIGYVFVAHAFEGQPRDCAEARPFWCSVQSLPFDRMWEDDRHWLPHVMDGRALTASFLFRGDRLVYGRVTPRTGSRSVAGLGDLVHSF